MQTESNSSRELPPVDLFILNYNGAHFLNQTLESVLNQTYPTKNVILSDNGSTDESVALSRPLEFRGLEIRVRSPGTGDCYSHYNVCLREVRSPYVGIFHGDDIYAPTMVEKQIRFLEEHPEIDAVLTAGMAIDTNNKILWPIQIPKNLSHPILNRGQVFEQTLKCGNSFLICPSALFRSSVFKKVGHFKAELPYCGDLEMWFRILFEGGGLGYLAEPLIRYRMSTVQGSSVYENNREEESEFFKMCDSYLQKNSVSLEVRQRFEALRHLDLYLAGLNQLSKRGDFRLFQQELNWFFQIENRKHMQGFGIVDRMKLMGGKIILPFSRTKLGIPLAKFLIRRTDSRASWLIQTGLKFKRMIHGA